MFADNDASGAGERAAWGHGTVCDGADDGQDANDGTWRPG